jgi:hypothetical protein
VLRDARVRRRVSFVIKEYDEKDKPATKIEDCMHITGSMQSDKVTTRTTDTRDGGKGRTRLNTPLPPGRPKILNVR